MNAAQLLTQFDRVMDASNALPRLRQLILDLAVRGKLLAQNAEEAPVKSTDKYANPPFDVPITWTWSKLRDVGDWGSGSTPLRNKSEYYDGKHIWLKSGELGDNQAVKQSSEKITDLALKECSFRLNKPGDVLIAMYGATIGKLAILAVNAVTNQAVCACTVNERVINSFLFLFLLSRRQDFHRQSEGGAQPNISKIKIINSPIPLPPLAEQHRIVARVDELMALCDQIEAAQLARDATRQRMLKASLSALSHSASTDDLPETIAQRDDRSPVHFALTHLPQLCTRPEHIQQWRQAILDLAVRGKLVAQDAAEEPIKNLLDKIHVVTRQQITAFDLTNMLTPKGWTWIKLGEFCTKTGSGSTPIGGKESYLSKGIPFLRSQNIYDNGLRLEVVAFISESVQNKMISTTVKPHDLLLNITGGSIGRCAIVPDDFVIGNINQHVAIIRPAILKCAKYLHVVIRSSIFQVEIFGNQTGAGREGLPKNRMDEIAIPVPPLAEQHRIVARVDELMQLCDQLEAQLSAHAASSARLLDAVMAQALVNEAPPMP